MSVTRICLRARNFLPGGLNKAVSGNPRDPRQEGGKGRKLSERCDPEWGLEQETGRGRRERRRRKRMSGRRSNRLSHAW